MVFGVHYSNYNDLINSRHHSIFCEDNYQINWKTWLSYLNLNWIVLISSIYNFYHSLINPIFDHKYLWKFYFNEQKYLFICLWKHFVHHFQTKIEMVNNFPNYSNCYRKLEVMKYNLNLSFKGVRNLQRLIFNCFFSRKIWDDNNLNFGCLHYQTNFYWYYDDSIYNYYEISINHLNLYSNLTEIEDLTSQNHFFVSH